MDRRAAARAVAALTVILTLRSLRWPLIHDAPLLHYIAARLIEGGAETPPSG
jgi:hypothetical protein